MERKLKALQHEREELDRALAERETARESRDGARRALEPLVVKHLDALVAHVRGALPFKVAERANEQGIRSRSGRPWSRGTIWNVLRA